MTQDEIIEMARQSGMVYRSFEDEFANANTDGVDLKTMIAFAKLAEKITGKPILFLGTGQEYKDLQVFKKKDILKKIL